MTSCRVGEIKLEFQFFVGEPLCKPTEIFRGSAADDGIIVRVTPSGRMFIIQGENSISDAQGMETIVYSQSFFVGVKVRLCPDDACYFDTGDQSQRHSLDHCGLLV